MQLNPFRQKLVDVCWKKLDQVNIHLLHTHALETMIKKNIHIHTYIYKIITASFITQDPDEPYYRQAPQRVTKFLDWKSVLFEGLRGWMTLFGYKIPFRREPLSEEPTTT